MLNTLIDQLEATLEAPASAESDELAARIAERLLAVSVASPREERLKSVRGLMVLYAHYYRVGRLGAAGQMLAAADELSADLDSLSRVNVLLRRGEFELLCWDTGAALLHTVKAMEIARASGLRLEEARAWSNHGMALQEAGLVRQADKLLAHALELLAGLDEPRLAGNIWAQRCQLSFHLDSAALEAARHACREALRYAEVCPARYRDSMACTALCNAAALEILHGNLAEAGEFLGMAG